MLYFVKIPFLVLIVVLFALNPVAAETTKIKTYQNHPKARDFAREVALRNNMDLRWVQGIVYQAQKQSRVISLIYSPPKKSLKNWQEYRNRLVNNDRIVAGELFWRTHKEWLIKAEKDYGVPPEIVIGILGVETVYGQFMGKFRIVDALATLAFDFPQAHPRAKQRAAFFKKELENLLKLARQQKTDPLSYFGSYAGAIGLPQFMPGSWLAYAVDYDQDGKIDLINSPADAIGSIAHYLYTFGWQVDLEAFYPVKVNSSIKELELLLEPDILPTFEWADLVSKGLVLGELKNTDQKNTPIATKPQDLFALIELRNDPEGTPEYVVGTQNFYTLTRYNRSSYYAMAVLSLGKEVKEHLNR